MIREGDKIKLKTGEVALISEVLEEGVAYIAEIIRRGGGFSVTVDHVMQDEIQSVFEEVERPISA